MGFSKPCQLNEWQAQKGCQLKQQQFPQAVSWGYDTQTTFGAKVDGQFSQRLWPTVFFRDTLLPYSPLCYRHWFCLSCQSHPCWGQYCLALFSWIVVMVSGKGKKKCTQHKQTNEKKKGRKIALTHLFSLFFFCNLPASCRKGTMFCADCFFSWQCRPSYRTFKSLRLLSFCTAPVQVSEQRRGNES